MYRILHIFQMSEIADDFIKFINNSFRDNEHEIWIYGDIKLSKSYNDLLHYGNVKHVHDITKKLKLNKASKFDKIFCHGIFDKDVIDCFFKSKALLKKLYLYFWGDDKFLRGTNIETYKKKKVINNAYAIINILPEEKKFMKNNYNMRGKQYCAMYGPHSILENCDRYKKVSVKDYIAVQVGNSATPTNNHVFLLRKLSKFRNQNIKIFVPLSYGDKEYADRVIKVGQDLLGGKFIPMTDYMDVAEYYEHLSQIDIALFGMKRQQALGNIIALLYMGKKVYLREHSILEHYSSNVCCCNIATVEEIDRICFDQFISFEQAQAEINRKIMCHMFQKDSVTEKWNMIFNEKI